MQFLTDPKIDFMRYRAVLTVVSIALIVAGLLYVFVLGKLNIGIDFAGGTQVRVQFQEQPDLDRLRSVLNEAGFPAALIQRLGEVDANEVLIRTATVEGSEEGSADALLEAMDTTFNPGLETGTDINRQSADAVARLLARLDPDGHGAPSPEAPEVAEPYQQAADAILSLRREDGLIKAWEELEGVAGVSPSILDSLKENAQIGDLAILAVENVGPQIGSELKRQGIWAVVLSLMGMLAYIWYRFELRFGVGAVAAIFHDVAITLAFYAFGGFEFNVTTIAAFLTLVGYSVNDTVVVFDRVRENMRRSRREPLVNVLNTSINQTLSRTIMTSGTTLLVVLTLFLYGGDVLEGFAFILLIGIVVGTYSSIYVASPVVLLWERYFGREARIERAKAR